MSRGNIREQCHVNASNGQSSIAVVDDAVWLKASRLKGPAWLGALGLPPRWPPRHPPSYFDVKSFRSDAQSLQLSGEVHLPQWPTSPLNFTAARDEKLRDSDHDGIPDETERCFGLSPDKTDTDGDGIPDAADPAPMTKPAQADPRTPLVRAALMYIARFEEPTLWSVVTVDAPPGLLGVAEGVAAMSLPAEPSSDCHLQALQLQVQPEAPPTTAHGRRRHEKLISSIRIDEITNADGRGTVRAVFDYGFHGRTIRFEFVNTSGAWRVVRRRVQEDWIQ